MNENGGARKIARAKNRERAKRVKGRETNNQQTRFNTDCPEREKDKQKSKRRHEKVQLLYNQSHKKTAQFLFKRKRRRREHNSFDLYITNNCNVV